MNIYMEHLEPRGTVGGREAVKLFLPLIWVALFLSWLLCDLRTFSPLFIRERSHGEANRVARKQPGWDRVGA
jgi:hypothetical protein